MPERRVEGEPCLLAPAYVPLRRYTRAQAAALFTLAQSEPTPEEYRRERERILAQEPS